MKSLRESSGFTVDNVDEIADNLQDALEANREISDALNASKKRRDTAGYGGSYMYLSLLSHIHVQLLKK